jgi:hypothetical protein
VVSVKVKVGGLVFASEMEPIMIKLEPFEKADIANMLEEDTKYCVFPDHCSEEEIKRFMEVL